MLHDIQQVKSVPVSDLKNTHFVGLMTFTRDQFASTFGNPDASPAKVTAQLQRFNNAYKTLDEAYKTSTYSLDTERLRQADDDCDRTFMGIKKMVQAQQAFDFNPTVKDAADRMMQAIARFDISPDEDYLGENSKLQQLLNDVRTVASLTDDAATLGLTEAFAQLADKVDLVRKLITQREAGKTPKGAMKVARQQMEPEYRWLIAILNAAALMDDDEHRFDPLITVLNANIDYLKKNVIRKGGIVWDDETDTELDEEDFDEEPTDEEAEDEKPQTDPTEE
jgi:hypothetical protein